MGNPNVTNVTPLPNNVSVAELKGGARLKIKHIFNKGEYDRREVDEQQIDWIVYKNA